MVRKFLGALGLTICLIAMTMMIASADPPTPTDQSRGKPTSPPGLSKTPAAEKEKEKEKEKEQEQDKEKGKHAVFGLVTSKAADSFVVKPKKGDDVTVKVTSNTRFQIPTKKSAGFGDLNTGDTVAVNGTPVAGGLEAKKVGIVPGKPITQHRVGIVTAYTAGASITIEDSHGEKSTFQLTKDTEIRDPKGIGLKADGKVKVTVVSRRDPSTNVFTAQAIVVHPK